MADKLECFSLLFIVDENVSVNQTDARKCQNEDDEMSPDQFEDAAVPDQNHFAESDEWILCVLVATGVDVGMPVVHGTFHH